MVKSYTVSFCINLKCPPKTKNQMYSLFDVPDVFEEIRACLLEVAFIPATTKVTSSSFKMVRCNEFLFPQILQHYKIDDTVQVNFSQQRNDNPHETVTHLIFLQELCKRITFFELQSTMCDTFDLKEKLSTTFEKT